MSESARARLLQVLRHREVSAVERTDWPLSSAQLRMWLLEQLQPGNPAYHEPTAVRLLGRVSLEGLETGLAALVERHEMLRTAFRAGAGEPTQVVLTAWRPTVLEREASLGQVEGLIQEACAAPFDLERGPLLRVQLFRLGEDDQILLLILHHIVIDGWSADLLVRELVAHLAGTPRPTPSPLSYRSFAAWQRERPVADSLAYWKKRLKDLQAVELPGTPTPSGTCQRIHFALADSVAPLAQRYHCTPFAVLLVAWGLTLRQWTGGTDLPIAVPVSQRERKDTEKLVGLFLNTLVIRLDLSGDSPLGELLQRCWRDYSADFAHQQCSFEGVVADHLSVMLNLQPVASPAYRCGPLQVQPCPSHNGKCKFDLNLVLVPQADGGWSACLEYSQQRFAAAAMHRLTARFVHILHRLCTNPEARPSQLGLPDQECQALEAFQAGRTSIWPEADMVALFRQQPADAPALLQGDQIVSFGELDRLSNQLAWTLRERGARAGERVVLHWGRDWSRWVGLLAVLKTGAAFVPVEAEEPEGWLETIVADAQPVAVLRGTDWREQLDARAHDLPTQVGQEGPLALLYTSGSTGRARGVMVSQSATLNRFHWMWREFPFDSKDVLCQRSPFGFVDCLWELLGGLLAGRPTCLISSTDPEFLAEALQRNRVTRLVMVPSLLNKLLVHAPKLGYLRLVVSSGETLPSALAQAWRAQLPQARLLNLYGSTEVSGDVTWQEVGAEVHLGRPVDNCQIRLLDEHGQPVPWGALGEIYVAGANLALGYWGGEQQRFEGGRFRTGDLGHWDEQGNLHYRGRRDRLIKLRGLRIEPELLESTLAACPGVQEAYACVRNEQLLAYVAGTGDAEQWSAHLRQQLPRAYWPARYLSVASLPRNGRGKVDESALPTPDRPITAGGAARDGREQILLPIWREHLRSPQLGVSDNFFEHGGHSLTAVALLAACERSLGQKLTLADLFEHPTVEAMALRMQQPEQESAQSLVCLQSGQGLPLFFIHAMGGGLDYYGDLIGELGPDRAIWGFYGVDPGPHDWTLADLAERYIDELLRRHPQGPYQLLGLSLGGSIGYQMACSLRARGRDVRLIIIDSYAPGYYRAPLPGQAAWQKKHHLWQRLQLQLGHLIARVPLRRWPAFCRSKLRNFEGAPPPRPKNHPMEQMRQALADYRPPAQHPPLQASVLILRANYQPWHLRDPYLGWRSFLAQEPEVRVIPGMHGTTLVEMPIATGLARLVGEFLL